MECCCGQGVHLLGEDGCIAIGRAICHTEIVGVADLLNAFDAGDRGRGPLLNDGVDRRAHGLTSPICQRRRRQEQIVARFQIEFGACAAVIEPARKQRGQDFAPRFTTYAS